MPENKYQKAARAAPPAFISPGLRSHLAPLWGPVAPTGQPSGYRERGGTTQPFLGCQDPPLPGCPRREKTSSSACLENSTEAGDEHKVARSGSKVTGGFSRLLGDDGVGESCVGDPSQGPSHPLRLDADVLGGRDPTCSDPQPERGLSASHQPPSRTGTGTFGDR